MGKIKDALLAVLFWMIKYMEYVKAYHDPNDKRSVLEKYRSIMHRAH